MSQQQIEKRMELERRVVRHLIRTAKAHGYAVTKVPGLPGRQGPVKKYIGGFLMLGGLAAMGVSFLGLALAIVDPVAGGMATTAAVLTGAAGAFLVGDE